VRDSQKIYSEKIIFSSLFFGKSYPQITFVFLFIFVKKFCKIKIEMRKKFILKFFI